MNFSSEGEALITVSKDLKISSMNLNAQEILNFNNNFITEIAYWDEWAAIDQYGEKIEYKNFPPIECLNSGYPITHVILGIEKSGYQFQADAIPMFEVGNYQPTLVIFTLKPIGLIHKVNLPTQERHPPSFCDINQQMKAMLLLAKVFKKFHLVENESSPIKGKSLLSYALFLELMQCSHLGTTDVAFKEIVHIENFCHRRSYDHLKWLEKEEWIVIYQRNENGKLSKELYISCTPKLRNLFLVYSASVIGALNCKKT
jgi:hypothetical protein